VTQVSGPESATGSAVAAGRAPSAERAEFFGHPRGLGYIAGTEFWERVSFHGMLALLTLYMAGELLMPGHVERIWGFAGFRSTLELLTGRLSAQALASQISGLYVGFVYLMPVIGGILGDRVIGRRLAVALGALLMTVGHFCMAFEPTFLVALLLLVVGAGLLRGNLISQFGDLYAKGDHRRESAFQIYYAVLNTGASIAPVITGTLEVQFGWHYGFGFAGVGMLLGLLIYGAGRRYVPADLPRRATGTAKPLGPGERRVIVFMILMLPLLTLFWVAQTQIWNTYNLWARDHLNLTVGAYKMPVPWLQAIDSVAVVVLVIPLLRFWRWQSKRGQEPDDLQKMVIGCLLFGVAVAWLAASQLVAPELGSVPLAWAIAYHFFSGVGYIYFAPTAIAVFARSAPAAVNALMVGVYYLSMFAGSITSGRLGGLYERISAGEFWALHAAIVSAGGVLLLCAAPRLRRELGLER
jgi:proton-dependent oligopeptide transporter, POT family